MMFTTVKIQSTNLKVVTKLGLFLIKLILNKFKSCSLVGYIQRLLRFCSIKHSSKQ